MTQFLKSSLVFAAVVCTSPYASADAATASASGSAITVPGASSYLYDQSGRVIKAIDAKGVVLVYIVYDAQGTAHARSPDGKGINLQSK